MPLIDRYLPNYHFSETHARLVSAPPTAILAAVAAYRAETDWFFRVMIRLREAPARLVGRRDAQRAPFDLTAFTLLARNEGEIVYGLIGRFWSLGFGLAPVVDGTDFLAYDQGDAAKLALTFRTHPHSDGRTRLVTETRVSCPS